MSGWLTDHVNAAIDLVGPQCTEGFIHAVTSRADVHSHPPNVFHFHFVFDECGNSWVHHSDDLAIYFCKNKQHGVSLSVVFKRSKCAIAQLVFIMAWALACIKIGHLVQQDWVSCANLWNECKLSAFPWVFCRSNFPKHGCNKKWIWGFKPSKTSNGCHANMELCTVVVGLGLVVRCLMDEVKDNFGAIITGSLAVVVATCLVTASHAIITSYPCLLHHCSFATCGNKSSNHSNLYFKNRGIQPFYKILPALLKPKMCIYFF